MTTEFQVRLPALLDKLYAAALDATLMPAFLAELSASFHAGAGVVRLVSNDLTTRSYAYGHQPEFIQSFAAHYSELNPITGSMLARMPVGRVMFASDLIPADQLTRTEFYNDWMRPQEASAHHCGVVFEKGDGGFSVMTVSPKSRDFEENRDRYANQLAQLVPHLARAAQISRLSHSPQLSTAGALDSFGLPTIVLGGTGQLFAANTSAERLLRESDPLRLSADGYVFARRGAEDAVLKAAIAATVSATVLSARGPIRLSGKERNYLSWLLPDRLMSISAPSLSASPGYAYLIVRPIQTPRNIDIDALRDAFDITVAETRLLRALLEGQTLEQFAEANGVSRNTARNQLSALFAKTNTSRQAELVSLVLNSLGGSF